MMPCVKRVPPRGVCMMGRFFVGSALMMLGCFLVVARRMLVVFCRLLVVFGCLLGHGLFPLGLQLAPRKGWNARFLTVM